MHPAPITIISHLLFLQSDSLSIFSVEMKVSKQGGVEI
jgi:hypothetical protein